MLSILISEINVEVVERVLNRCGCRVSRCVEQVLSRSGYRVSGCVGKVLSRSGCRLSGCGPVMVRGVQNDIHNS